MINFDKFENKQNKPKYIGKTILGVFILIGITQILPNIKFFEKEPEYKPMFSQEVLAQNMITEEQRQQQKLGDEFYASATNGATPPSLNVTKNEKIASANTTSPKTTKPKAEANTEKMVTLSVANVGRANPFVPFADLPNSSTLPPTFGKTKAGYVFPSPPTQVSTDETAVKLMQTTISGIMFDTFSPSAIVNVDGQDHLVRKGDRINGYKILNITKDRVVVQNGTNIYRASVGETLTTQSNIHFNNVYNLENKFGGSFAPTNTQMLKFN